MDLTPDLEAFTFQGVAKIDFTVDHTKLNETNSKEISLHAKELCFASASYEAGDGTTVVAEEIHFNTKTTIVKFLFGTPISGDKITLKIE